MRAPYLSKLTLGYSLLRSTHFALQQLGLQLYKQPNLSEKHKPDLRKILPEIYKLLKEDSENIEKGIYPIDVLKPEKYRRHLIRYPQIILDAFQVTKRRKNKKAHEFDNESREFLKDVPEYYQRNFHYQSGGYLTQKSAELYEHQVEILFAGAGDAMRRMIIPMLKEKYPGDGEGLHFLEVAAGTGRLTRFMKLAFPKVRITVMDLSFPYLKKAQQNLSDFSRINFLQGAAEELPFSDKTFDAVFSCFLFHELPFEVRKKVILEGQRVLKPGGAYGLVDSIQNEDARDLTWALEQFPTNFHEPFFKNYVMNPIEGQLIHAGFKDVKNHRGFFSKAVLGLN